MLVCVTLCPYIWLFPLSNSAIQKTVLIKSKKDGNYRYFSVLSEGVSENVAHASYFFLLFAALLL